MGTSVNLGQFVGKIDKASKALSSKSLNAAGFKRLGAELAPLARIAASGTVLGSDAAFTRGSKGRANQWFKAPLEARAGVHTSGFGVTIGRTRASAGQWAVAEEGRGNNIGPVMPKVLKSGKLSKARQHKRSARFNGQTAGFGAWSAAEARMAKVAPERLNVHFTQTVLGVFR